MRQSAMFFFSTGDRVPLVTTPTCVPADMHAVAVPAGSLPFQLEPDEHALRMRAPFASASLADEVVLLVRRSR